ncbi:amidophosphoribosyltransferase [Candidatus Micrarchaeota archaeon]|nr:amidophosphoribosyltransferase [Candidatus Micrarchaeota archaeon]
MPEEACGVFAVLKPKGENVVLTVKQGLEALQHRGQDSSGMTALKEEGLLTRRAAGLVSRLDHYLGELKSHAIIGQVRYPTTGKSLIENAQPVQFKDFSIAFNGNISNYNALREKLEAQGMKFKSDVDVEVIGQLVQKQLNEFKARGGKLSGKKEEKFFVNALRAAMKELNGSYSIVLLTKNGGLFAARDPLGYKPLSYARHGNDGWVISSETRALDEIKEKNPEIEFKKLGEVKPGAILSFTTEGKKQFAGLSSKRLAHCAFELIYFSHRDSVVAGVKVIDARRRLGAFLASKGIKGDVVVPVPNSGIQAAHGVAAGLNVPLVHAIKKTGKVGEMRTFIAPSQEVREALSREKYELADPKAVKGKRVILVDDSIVRGTSMPVLIRMLKEAGAKEVHVAVSAPQIVSPCFMGINFPTKEELIAWKNTPKQVLKEINEAIIGEKLAGKVVKGSELQKVLTKAGGKKVKNLHEKLGADSLVYTNITDLIKAIGLPGKLCLACFSGVYPEEEKQPLKILAEREKMIKPG